MADIVVCVLHVLQFGSSGQNLVKCELTPYSNDSQVLLRCIPPPPPPHTHPMGVGWGKEEDAHKNTWTLRSEHATFCVEVFYTPYINFHSFIHVMIHWYSGRLLIITRLSCERAKPQEVFVFCFFWLGPCCWQVAKVGQN